MIDATQVEAFIATGDIPEGLNIRDLAYSLRARLEAMQDEMRDAVDETYRHCERRL